MTTPMDLKVRVLGDISQFDGAMRQAAGSLDGFRNAIAGAVSIGAAAAYIDQITGKAERISDTSRALGISAEAMQAVDYAARHAGSSFDELRTVFATLSQKQGELMKGSKEAAQQFSALGLSAKAVQSMSLEELFDAVARAIANGTDRATSMANAVDLLGRQAKTAMGTLREIGAVGLGGTIDAARASGQIVDQSQLDQIAAARDAVEDLKTSLDNFVVRGIGDTIALFRELKAGIASFFSEGSFWAGYDREQMQAQEAQSSFVLGEGEVVNEKEKAAKQKAADADKAHRDAVSKENKALEAIFTDLERNLQRYSLTEETRLRLRQRDLERLTREGSEEERRLQADGKWEEARNAGLRSSIEAMKLQGEIAELEKDVKRKVEARAQEEARFQASLSDIRVAAPEAADAMARIGGYSGGQTDPAQNTRNRQLEVQKRIEEHTRRMAEKDGGVTA